MWQAVQRNCPNSEKLNHLKLYQDYKLGTCEQLDISDTYWNSKDPYKDIIKKFVKWLKN